MEPGMETLKAELTKDFYSWLRADESKKNGRAIQEKEKMRIKRERKEIKKKKGNIRRAAVPCGSLLYPRHKVFPEESQ